MKNGYRGFRFTEKNYTIIFHLHDGTQHMNPPKRIKVIGKDKLVTFLAV
jgi:hypothetical protein